MAAHPLKTNEEVRLGAFSNSSESPLQNTKSNLTQHKPDNNMLTSHIETINYF